MHKRTNINRDKHILIIVARICLLLATSVMLVACGGGEFEDLQQYVSEVKSRPGAKIPRLPEAKPYERFLYEDADLRDPFKPTIKASSAAIGGNQLINNIRPNTSRDAEALEQFPLDTLRMVGSLNQNKEKWGIVKTTDGYIYRVKTGNHVGKNFGKITRISDSEIKILEIISDGMGGWLEREAALKISE